MSQPLPYAAPPATAPAAARAAAPRSDAPFYILLLLLSGAYIVFIAALLVSDATYFSSTELAKALASPNIQFSIVLSLISCTIAAAMSVLVAVPLGFLLSRYSLPRHQLPAVGGESALGHFLTANPVGRAMLWLITRTADTIIDVPIVLPPLVLGLSLLIFMQTLPGKSIEALSARYLAPITLYGLLPATLLALLVWSTLGLVGALRETGSPVSYLRISFYTCLLAPTLVAIVLTVRYWDHLSRILDDALSSGITYAAPAVVLAQFSVAAAFAVRTMRVAFDQISPRAEQIALTLGASRAQAFWKIVLPQAWRGVLTAFTLAWARALGEFGPILIFAGATRMRTEVLSTTVFLELSIGQIEAAIAVSLLMIALALLVLTTLRLLSLGTQSGRGVL